ncbi:hypothetical protein [Streptomyces sp. NPDC017993]|uniref:hypothetical protein n=1 Tax=Streptomyces sp. NPDC017993 TaxID=3365027 RepID=UPI00379EC01C
MERGVSGTFGRRELLLGAARGQGLLVFSEGGLDVVGGVRGERCSSSASSSMARLAPSRFGGMTWAASPTHSDEGLRAAVEIRKRWPGVVVLVLSSNAEWSATKDRVGKARGGGCHVRCPFVGMSGRQGSAPATEVVTATSSAELGWPLLILAA